ncbi:hypothetical protein H6P81_007795 [Aristolochia fimbriata]|uniref:Uncharacterized protein n=1 Tax=Aristolochia fimbriata TaxID=158543 RepID=A0AAV7F4X6_ARIFI|nr:hypothetical protein H6P81_007795 [Aristolochia fimbriata]
MDEQEFRRLLDLFPVVRTRDYCAEPQRPRELTSHSVPYEVDSWQDAWAEDDMREYEVQRTDDEDLFWKKLRLAAERKMSPAEADKFCRAFQRVHKKLVNEELSIEAAKKILHARS